MGCLTVADKNSVDYSVVHFYNLEKNIITPQKVNISFHSSHCHWESGTPCSLNCKLDISLAVVLNYL